MNITFSQTRNIDLIEAIGNHPDNAAGSNNGDVFLYDPACVYIATFVDGDLAGIGYFKQVQPSAIEIHAMILNSHRKKGVKIARDFVRFLLANSTFECFTSMAAEKFRHGQLFCSLVGLRRVGTIERYFKGRDNVTIYAATRYQLENFLGG